jgi:succinate dehydrogenase/fumarate reductase cytochrome b subunit
MEKSATVSPVEYKRDVMSLAEWRATQVGMWAWLMQRVTALGSLAFVFLHLVYPYEVIYQVLLLSFVCFHLVLGLRVIVLDIGARVGLQKVLFGALIAFGILVVVLRWRVLY